MPLTRNRYGIVVLHPLDRISLENAKSRSSMTGERVRITQGGHGYTDRASLVAYLTENPWIDFDGNVARFDGDSLDADGKWEVEL